MQTEKREKVTAIADVFGGGSGHLKRRRERHSRWPRRAAAQVLAADSDASERHRQSKKDRKAQKAGMRDVVRKHSTRRAPPFWRRGPPHAADLSLVALGTYAIHVKCF